MHTYYWEHMDKMKEFISLNVINCQP